MKALNKNSIDIINYICALDNLSITTDIRKQVKTYIKDINSSIELLDKIISVMRKKVENHSISGEEAYKTIETEYKKLGMNTYLNFEYISELLFIGLTRIEINNYTQEDTITSIKSIIEIADKCEDDNIKHDMYLLCLQILNAFDLIVYNIELTKKILEKVREDESTLKVFPLSLI